ncbi:MAG: TIGR00282 family metallophosphoesterase [bacterium]|nr:TIGR00282 family metallophosphoesterase [bacterium]
MRGLFLGDLVGRAGRDAVKENLSELRSHLSLDYIVVNAENVAGGFGITEAIAEDLFAWGVDVITTGNHAWDQRGAMPYYDEERRLLRPHNYPPGAPGSGVVSIKLPNRKSLTVINVMGRLFMDALDDPFQSVQKLFESHILGDTCDALIVDMHAETSSEKMAMGRYCDGRASMVVGTHTHTPTADAQIFPKGTGYQTDAGMCGDYDSIIGMKIKASVDRFVHKLPTERLQPSNGEGTLCGVYIETDDTTGKCQRIEPLRVGPHLHSHLPKV